MTLCRQMKHNLTTEQKHGLELLQLIILYYHKVKKEKLSDGLCLAQSVLYLWISFCTTLTTVYFGCFPNNLK